MFNKIFFNRANRRLIISLASLNIIFCGVIIFFSFIKANYILFIVYILLSLYLIVYLLSEYLKRGEELGENEIRNGVLKMILILILNIIVFNFFL